MRCRHASVTVSSLDYLWSKAVKITNPDIMAHIEEILDNGPSCAQFMADIIKVDVRRVTACINAMKRDKLIEKADSRMVAGVKVPFFKMPDDKPVQVSMIMEPARRDPLVAALFGDA